jgi:hypothetical protein
LELEGCVRMMSKGHDTATSAVSLAERTCINRVDVIVLLHTPRLCLCPLDYIDFLFVVKLVNVHAYPFVGLAIDSLSSPFDKTL